MRKALSSRHFGTPLAGIVLAYGGHLVVSLENSSSASTLSIFSFLEEARYPANKFWIHCMFSAMFNWEEQAPVMRWPFAFVEVRPVGAKGSPSMLAEVAVGRVCSLPRVPPGPPVEPGFLSGGSCVWRVSVSSRGWGDRGAQGCWKITFLWAVCITGEGGVCVCYSLFNIQLGDPSVCPEQIVTLGGAFCVSLLQERHTVIKLVSGKGIKKLPSK